MAKQPWKLEATDRRVRVEFNGEVIADSTNTQLMIEHPGELHYYFPVADVKTEYLVSSDHTEKSGYRGTAVYSHLQVGDKTSDNAVFTYPETKANRPDLSGYVTFKWNAVDAWYEEAEQVYLHPRNPYHRVDAIHSNRTIKIVVNGETIAESDNPVMVFETGLTTRYYLPPEDVNEQYLTTTETHSVCPYKGKADYWTVTANGEQYEDIVWAYPDPIAEMPKLKGLKAFWTEKDKAIEIYIDGQLQSA